MNYAVIVPYYKEFYFVWDNWGELRLEKRKSVWVSELLQEGEDPARLL